MKIRSLFSLTIIVALLGMVTACEDLFKDLNKDPGKGPDNVPDSSKSEYTVNFEANGGSPAPKSQTIASGGKVIEPAVTMIRIGYGFGGWYKETACINLWNFATDTVTRNITLYAKWSSKYYTVSFDVGGGNPALEQQDIAPGGKVIKPTDISKTGYTFDGWYKEEGYINLWDFDADTISESIILYAKWVENIDWEYEELPDGTAQLTVWLDGPKPTAPSTQSRALNLTLAKMSHDYFEAVFVHPATSTIARATWELGQTAGIRDMYRSNPGVDYRGIDTSTGPASVVFVGRKQTMTLMGVGILTHINKVPIGNTGKLLTSADSSVTFTVSPLTMKIGIDPNSNTAISTPAASSFLTAGKTPYASVSVTNTVGKNIALGGTEYPLFILPDWETHTGAANTATIALSNGVTLAIGTAKTIPATYTISGLTAATGLPAIPGSSVNDLTTAIRLYDVPEVIKRSPSYISGGQTWYAYDIDLGTIVDIPTVGTGAYTTPKNDPLNPVLPINFHITQASNGIFSILFSIPVYALTDKSSTNSGSSAAIWYIRPGYGQNLYNLDNGADTGGCVLMGINITSLNWEEIFTVQGWRN